MMIDLALIPARAGSVGLPGKNIADLGGVPLIGWTVRAALASNCFKRVVVSTDSPDIAVAAKAAGAEVPFMRPHQLATSHARSYDVIHHALEATGTNGSFALMQPTSPFRAASHIHEAVQMFCSSTSNTALTSIEKGKPSAWLFTQTIEGYLSPIKEIENSDQAIVYRRQDAQPTFAPNGAIYLCETETFQSENTLFPESLLGYSMGTIDSIDIDEPEDLTLARAIVTAKLRQIDL